MVLSKSSSPSSPSSVPSPTSSSPTSSSSSYSKSCFCSPRCSSRDLSLVTGEKRGGPQRKKLTKKMLVQQSTVGWRGKWVVSFAAGPKVLATGASFFARTTTTSR